MIYFVQSVEGGPVKIGHSADVPARVRQLEACYRQPLAILATMPGGQAEEQAIHERFSSLRFGKTEQFRPTADLMAFIGRPLLVGLNPKAIPSKERLTVFSLKGSPEYRDWLNDISGKSLIPTAVIVRDALAKWSKERNYSDPPEV